MYTVGRVGRTKVVSTKLPRIPGTAQAAIISAENTVTRLLGRFGSAQAAIISAENTVTRLLGRFGIHLQVAINISREYCYKTFR